MGLLSQLEGGKSKGGVKDIQTTAKNLYSQNKRLVRFLPRTYIFKIG